VASKDSLVAARHFIVYVNPVYFMDRPAIVSTVEGTILMEWCDFDSEEYISFEFIGKGISCHIKDTSGTKAKWKLEGKSDQSILRAQSLLFNYYNDKRPTD